MTDEQAYEIFEKLERISTRLDATARAVRFLSDGLTLADKNHQSDLTKIEKALLELSVTVGHVDLSSVTADDLANFVSNRVICKAREIQWKRKKEGGEPGPLPDPPPTDLVTRRPNGREDSLAIKTDHRGQTRIHANVQARTIVLWISALVTAGLSIYHMVAEHLGKASEHMKPPP